MGQTISTGNIQCQPQLFPIEINSAINGFLQCGMGKTSKLELRDIYLGPWLAVREVSETDAAKAARVDQSYIANIVAGKKKNPSALILLAISEKLEITVNDLYQPPPPRAQIVALSNLSDKARGALFGKKRRKG